MYKHELLPIQQKKVLQKAKKNYSNEKAAEYYLKNKDAIKEKSMNHYKSLLKEEKTRLNSIKEKDISN